MNMNDPHDVYGNYSKEDLIARIAELECATSWWLEEKMKNYSFVKHRNS